MSRKKITYRPSYDFSPKGVSRYKKILGKYRDVFAKAASDYDSITEEEKLLLFNGVEDVVSYLVNGLLYFFTEEEYESKSGRDKVSTAAFQRIASVNGISPHSLFESFSENFENLANESLLEALGLIEPSRKSFLWNPDESLGNIIRFTRERVLKEKLRDFLLEEVAKYDIAFEVNEEDDDIPEVGDIEKRLKSVPIISAMSKKQFDELVLVIKGEKEASDEIAPFLRLLEKLEKSS